MFCLKELTHFSKWLTDYFIIILKSLMMSAVKFLILVICTTSLSIFNYGIINILIYIRGVKLLFTGGHINLVVAF